MIKGNWFASIGQKSIHLFSTYWPDKEEFEAGKRPHKRETMHGFVLRTVGMSVDAALNLYRKLKNNDLLEEFSLSTKEMAAE